MDDLTPTRPPRVAVDGKLSTDQVQLIRDEMSMAHVWRARKALPRDDQARDRGIMSFWFSAQTLGLAPAADPANNDALLEFLERISTVDFNAAFSDAADAARGPKSNGGSA